LWGNLGGSTALRPCRRAQPASSIFLPHSGRRFKPDPERACQPASASVLRREITMRLPWGCWHTAHAGKWSPSNVLVQTIGSMVSRFGKVSTSFEQTGRMNSGDQIFARRVPNSREILANDDRLGSCGHVPCDRRGRLLYRLSSAPSPNLVSRSSNNSRWALPVLAQ
jgi:hypothetical protein